MIIKLVRHAESEANTGNMNPNRERNAAIPLSEFGKMQALSIKNAIEREFIDDALIYCSPYFRARQTLQILISSMGVEPEKVKIFEDPRLREIDVGYSDSEAQIELRRVHEWFYYRFQGGESAADCYDRTSAFLESMMRQIIRSNKHNVLIVCHGMSLRCFVARFLHLTVEQFELMHNPDNCDVVTIAKRELLDSPILANGRWGVEGIKLRN